jgi:transposase-like protein
MNECTGCGSAHLELVGAGERHGRPWARYECADCGSQFFAGRRIEPAASATVPYQRTACPHCRSTDNEVLGTKRQGRFTRRQHKCRACGLPFNSYEGADARG